MLCFHFGSRHIRKKSFAGCYLCIFLTFASLNALVTSDAVVDSSGLVRTHPKDMHQFEERQIPMQLDSHIAVATVTADGEVKREAFVNRNGHVGEGELLRSGRSQNALTSSDAVVDNGSFVRIVPHDPVATVTVDEDVEREALVHRNGHAIGVHEEPSFSTREASQSILALLSSRLAVAKDRDMIIIAGAAVVGVGIIAVASLALYYMLPKTEQDDGHAVLARAQLSAEDQLVLPRHEQRGHYAEHHPRHIEHAHNSVETPNILAPPSASHQGEHAEHAGSYTNSHLKHYNPSRMHKQDANDDGQEAQANEEVVIPPASIHHYTDAHPGHEQKGHYAEHHKRHNEHAHDSAETPNVLAPPSASHQEEHAGSYTSTHLKHDMPKQDEKQDRGLFKLSW
jgi:hypothetical protein